MLNHTQWVGPRSAVPSGGLIQEGSTSKLTQWLLALALHYLLRRRCASPLSKQERDVGNRGPQLTVLLGEVTEPLATGSGDQSLKVRSASGSSQTSLHPDPPRRNTSLQTPAAVDRRQPHAHASTQCTRISPSSPMWLLSSILVTEMRTSLKATLLIIGTCRLCT